MRSLIGLKGPARGRLVLLGLGLVVLLAGCQLVAGTAGTVRGITAETGVRDVSINLEGVRDYTVEVEYGTDETGEEAVRAEAEAVAGVVWRELPFEIERARMAPRGAPGGVRAVTYERDELEALFGARDPELDQDVGSILWPVLIVAVGVLLLAGLLTAVIAVTLVRRHERRRQAARAQAP